MLKKSEQIAIQSVIVFALLAVLWALGHHNYLFFHTIVELFSIVVAFGVFLFAWNTRRHIENNYLLFVGIGYLFVAVVDLLHTLAYKGMGVLPDVGANPATQLWLLGRGFEAATLLGGFVFLRRRLRPGPTLAAFAALLVLALLSIFVWRIFPAAYVEGTGLTPFKKAAEGVFILALAATAAVLIRTRTVFDREIFWLLLAALALTVLSELAFTLYVDVFGFFNFLGHVLKVLSFYLIYKAVIETGVERPYALFTAELRQKQQALARREERLSLATQAAELGVFEWSVVEDVVVWENRRMYDIFGFDPANDTPLNKAHFMGEHIHPDDAQAFEQTLADSMQPGRLFRAACRARRRDGAWRWVEFAGRFELDADNEPIRLVSILADITERREAEQQLRELTGHLEEQVAARTEQLELTVGQLRRLTMELSNAEDRERKRLASILHDDLQQILAGAKIHQSMLMGRIKDRPDLLTTARTVIDLLEESIQKSRGLSHELSPPVLYRGGLPEALQWLGERMESTHGIKVEVNASKHADPAAETLRLFLFRAAQEMLFNAVKHAETRTAQVHLQRFDGQIRLIVSDQGRGFEPEGVDQGFGLFSIQERVHILGGDFDIHSAPGAGSTFTLTLPDTASPMIQPA